MALGQAKISLLMACLRKLVLLIPLIFILPHIFANQVFGVFVQLFFSVFGLYNNNFQCVWTDGNNNNNNAYYSAGVRPGFCKYTRLHGVAENRLFSFQVKDNRCKRSYTSQG